MSVGKRILGRVSRKESKPRHTIETGEEKGETERSVFASFIEFRGGVH